MYIIVCDQILSSVLIGTSPTEKACIITCIQNQFRVVSARTGRPESSVIGRQSLVVDFIIISHLKVTAVNAKMAKQMFTWVNLPFQTT